MQIVEMLKPTEGEACQWLGVYVAKWQREWGEPSVMFRDVDVQEGVPEVKALVEAATAAANYMLAADLCDADHEWKLGDALNLALHPFNGGVE